MKSPETLNSFPFSQELMFVFKAENMHEQETLIVVLAVAEQPVIGSVIVTLYVVVSNGQAFGV